MCNVNTIKITLALFHVHDLFNQLVKEGHKVFLFQEDKENMSRLLN